MHGPAIGDKLKEATFTGRVGEVQANPTANTVLARLKDILSLTVLAAGTAIIGKVGIDVTTPGTTNKVALISGQDGVDGNSGNVSAKTQRVVLANNVPLPAGTATIGAVTTAPATAATLTNVASSASNVTLLAASVRRGGIFHNDSTANLFLKFGATASASSFTYKMAPGDTLELPSPIYQGIIDGIWSAADGFARITEIT